MKTNLPPVWNFGVQGGNKMYLQSVVSDNTCTKHSGNLTLLTHNGVIDVSITKPIIGSIADVLLRVDGGTFVV